MNSPSEFTDPINLGNPVEFTMLELAHLILDLTGSRSELIFLPLPGDDPKQRKPDISLAWEQLNWKPNTQLREGLMAMIEFFVSQARVIPLS